MASWFITYQNKLFMAEAWTGPRSGIRFLAPPSVEGESPQTGALSIGPITLGAPILPCFMSSTEEAVDAIRYAKDARHKPIWWSLAGHANPLMKACIRNPDLATASSACYESSF